VPSLAPPASAAEAATGCATEAACTAGNISFVVRIEERLVESAVRVRA
jgi:hypothetical protein